MEEDRYTRITLRIPKDLHAALTAEADATSKSLNAEIIGRLAESLVPSMPTSLLEAENRHLKKRIEDVSLMAEMEGTLATMVALSLGAAIGSLPIELREAQHMTAAAKMAKSVLDRERHSPSEYEPKDGEREVVEVAKQLVEQAQEFAESIRKNT